MLSVVSICRDDEKTEEFSRKLIKSDNTIWWGLHAWQDTYEPSGFIDSVREGGDSYKHWFGVLVEYELSEFIDDYEI